MATRKDIELAERFLNGLERKMEVWKRLFNEYTTEILANYHAENSAIRALIAHAKQTIPAEYPANCIGDICDLKKLTGVTCPDDSCDLDTGVREANAEPQPPAFDNPANADDYNTLHDYFDKGAK